MKRLYRDPRSCLWILLLIYFTGCSQISQERSRTRILNFTGDSKVPLEEILLETPGFEDAQVLDHEAEAYFNSDSLEKVSGLVLSASGIDRLDYRQLNALKRYLEAGGGGAILIKDNSTFSRKGWPWLQQWDSLAAATPHSRDQPPLYLLEPEADRQQWMQALPHAVGENKTPDYKDAQTPAVPDSSRYSKEVLTQGLDEPMQMAVLPDNDVIFVERKGAVKLFDSNLKSLKTIAHFDVFSGIEEGLLGVALDPDYDTNHWVYFYYAVADSSVNRLSRMELQGDDLVRSSEKVLLEIPTQRTYCCHSAGYLRFGPDGLLYLATGDNTNADDPYKVGYPPVDERPGHELADDQATAANTMDLRGKILRIRPEDDGSYSIPEGNLFPEGTGKTKPEIYVMGLRNPFRFTVDMKTGILYWGEVGPNTIVPGRDGTNMSYDEINRAAEPGFYGWPYFLGNNDAFPMYDFATGEEGSRKDPANPINDSPNNTGLQELPPARSAMIWYGPESSEQFPLVGSGGASAMAGPVYYSHQFSRTPYKLSSYYDGKLFIYDWIRNWIMAVTLDEQGRYVRMEPFLEHMEFASPMDMQFGPDGALYVLEYGSNWFSKNVDAKLVRIEYQEGNRNPVAAIRADKKYGGAPLTVKLSAADSRDYDEGDELQYRWVIGEQTLQGEQLTHTFDTSGVYKVTLNVEDGKGGEGSATATVRVGNSPPEVHIASQSNTSFYWDDAAFDYQVEVTDREDGAIDTSRVQFSFGYLENEQDVPVILSGSKQLDRIEHLEGQQLAASSDCRSCHAVDQSSVGPSFTAIAKRYRDEPEITGRLVSRIQEGGSGNWGDRVMPPHPGITTADAREIVGYILSLGNTKESRPLTGVLHLDRHGTSGAYLVSARYTDEGANGIAPLEGEDYVVLRNPRVEAELYDAGDVNVAHIATENRGYINNIRPGSYIRFDEKDLTEIASISYRVQAAGPGGTIEMHLDSPDGPLISSLDIPSGPAGGEVPRWRELTAEIQPTEGRYDLYFVFRHPGGGDENLFNLDWIYFSNK